MPADAGSILAAQDEPAQLADVRLGSALRNSPALISDNIEAALAATMPISRTALSNSRATRTS